MSNVIDKNDYIVSMEFDNSKFESNVETSLKTIDKLKGKLDFKDSSKSLVELEKAAGKVDLGPIGKSIDAIQDKFSALSIIGYSALNKLTSSAINAGERLVKSLSVDQISQGWAKYNDQTASVQTLTNATGKSVKEIEKYLESLMWFSDETSYSFTEMTKSLATMTSAGGDIDKLIPMIMGIANATSYAGKGAAEFQRVIYNLNQSYGQGALTYIDWKSVEGTNVNTKALVDTIIETGRELGTIPDNLEVTTANFRSTLAKGWVTTEVMEKAFGKFAELTLAVKDAIDAGEYNLASEAIEALGDQYSDIAREAFVAAQSAKSLSEAVEATKDAVSSGWMEIYKAVFGDMDEAKRLWTDVVNELWYIFAEPVQNKKDWIKGLMTNNNALDTFIDTLDDAGISIDDYEKALRKVDEEQKAQLNYFMADGESISDLIDKYGSLTEVINRGLVPINFLKEAFMKLAGTKKTVSDSFEGIGVSLETMQTVVASVIRGNYGNGAERVRALTEAGYNSTLTQTLVNKVWARTNGTWSSVDITAEDLAEAIGKLSDEEKRSIGLTEEQIESYDELFEQVKNGTGDFNDLFKAMSKPTGRVLIHNSITNLLKAVNTFMTLINRVRVDVFGTLDTGPFYNMLVAIEKFTKALVLEDVDAEELTGKTKAVADVLQTIFELLHIITTIISTGVKTAVAILKSFFSIFTSVSSDGKKLSETIKDLVHQFHEWLVTSGRIEKAFGWVESFAKRITEVIKKFIKFVKEFKPLMRIFNASKGAVTTISTSISSLFDSLDGVSVKESIPIIINFVTNLASDVLSYSGEILAAAFDIGKFLIQGLIDGMDQWLPSLWDCVVTAANGVISLFKQIFGINSPSLVMIAIGGMLILGLIKGLLGNISGLWKTTDELGEEGVSTTESVLSAIKKTMTEGFESIGDESSSVSSSVFEKIGESISKGLETIKESYQVVKEWMKENAPAAGEFLEQVIESIPTSVSGSVGAISVAKSVSRMLMGMKLTDAFSNFLNNVSSPLEGLGSFLEDTGIGLKKLMTGVGKLSKSIGTALKRKAFKQVGQGVLLIAAAIAVLVGALWALSKIDVDKVNPALDALGKIIIMVGLLVDSILIIQKLGAVASKNVYFSGLSSTMTFGSYVKNSQGIFGTIFAVAVLILACAKAMQMLQGITEADINKGLWTIAKIFAGIVGLVLAMRLTMLGLANSKGFKHIGSMLIKMVIALGLLVLVMKLIAKLTPEEIDNGMAFLKRFVSFVLILLIGAGFVGDGAMKYLGRSLIKLTLAMAIMLLICKLAGKLSARDITNGYMVAGILAGFLLVMGIVGLLANDAKIKAAGGAVLKIALSLLILTVALKILSTIDTTTMWNGIAGIGAMMVAIGIMIFALSKIPDVKAIGVLGAILGVVVLLGVMTMLIFVLQMFTPEQLKKAELALLGMAVIIFVLLIGIGLMGKLSGGNLGKVTAALIVIAVMLGEMVALVYLLKGIDEKTLWRLTAVIAILVGTLALLLVAASLTSAKNIAPLVGVIIILGMIGAGLYYMSKNMTSQEITKAERLTEAIAKTLIIVIGALIIMSILAAVMGKLKTGTLAKGFGHLFIVFAALAAFLAGLVGLGYLASISGEGWSIEGYLYKFIDILKHLAENWDALLVMAGMMAAMSIGARYLARVDPKYFREGVANLGMAFAALIGMLAVMTLSGWGADAIDAASKLQSFMDVLHVLVENIVELALFMGLLVVIAVAMALLTKIPTVGDYAKGLANFGMAFGALMGMLTLMTLEGGMLGGSWGPEKMQNFMSIMRVLTDNLPQFIVFMAAVYAVAIACATLAGIPVSLFATGVANFGMVVGLFEVLIASFAALGALAVALDKEGNGAAVINALHVFGDIMYEVAETFGKIISGFVEGLFYNFSLEKIAADIKQFMNDMQEPLEKIKAIDSSYAEGARNLMAVFGAIIVGDLAAFVEKFLGIKTGDLSTSMSNLGDAVVSFMTKMEGTDATSVSEKALAAADLVNTLNSIDFNDNFLGFCEVDMDEVKEAMGSLGEGIVDFMTAINGSEDVLKSDVDWEAVMDLGQHIADMMNSVAEYNPKTDIETFGADVSTYIDTIVATITKLNENASLLSDFTNIDNAITIGSKFVAFADTIPKKDGFVQKILGTEDIGVFGEQVEAYVTAIKNSGSIILSNLDCFGSDTTMYQNAIDIGAIFRDFQNTLPKDQGLVASIIPTADIAAFGAKVRAYVAAMSIAGQTLIENTAAFTTENKNRFSRAAEAGESFLKLAESVPSTVWWQKIFGDGGPADIGDFGEDVSQFIEAIAKVAPDLVGMDLSGFTSKKEDLQSIFDVFASDTLNATFFETAAFDPMAFMENMGYFVSGLTTLVTGVQGITDEGLNKALGYLTSLITFMDSLSANVELFNTFGNTFKYLAEAGIDGFVDAFGGDSDRLNTAIENLIANLQGAVNANTTEIQDVANSMCDIFKRAIASYNDLESAARSLINRFIAGLRGSMPAANAAMLRMADSMNKTFTVKQMIQSPSKLYEKYGEYIDLGLIEGIVNKASAVNDSVVSVGEGMLDEFGNIISQIQDGVDTNMDYDPTITPVVDLSNLEDAAGAIGGYFDGSIMPIDIIGDLGYIGNSFSGQNGRNYDVVSALDKLGSDIVNNTSGDSYVINGVTYEEGSDVAAAIQTLAHAAVVSGRR